MSSSSEVLTLSSDVVESLPIFYRAMAQHLAETGRAIIKGPSEKEQPK